MVYSWADGAIPSLLGTYEQHHVVNVKDIFEEVDGAAAVVSGPQPGGSAGQPLSAFSHDCSIRLFACLRAGRRRHLVTDSASTRNSAGLGIIPRNSRPLGELRPNDRAARRDSISPLRRNCISRRDPSPTTPRACFRGPWRSASGHHAPLHFRPSAVLCR